MFHVFSISTYYLIFTSILLKESTQYRIPTPIIELLEPKGFRISIPDVPGALFAFHGSINKKLRVLEPGDFEADIVKVNNGKWIYENKNLLLEPGDILYYSIHVQHKELGYRLLDQSYIIPKTGQSSIVNINDAVEDVSATEITKKDKVSKLMSDIERLQFIDERLKQISSAPVTEVDGCILSRTTVNGRKICQRSLIFEENFDVFNWTKWQRVIQIPSDSDDAEFVSYQDYPENCYINNGELHIVPTLLQESSGYTLQSVRNGVLNLGARCTSIVDIDITCKREAGFSRILPPVLSAKLRTKNFFSFRYGQVDIRAKLPKGDWIFPQLFLQPLNSDYGINGYASGQIRIAFIRGNTLLRSVNGEDINGQKLYAGVILATGETLREAWLKSKIRDEHFGNKYHTYTVVWDEDSITFALDGKSFATFQNGFKDLYHSHNISYAEKWVYGDKMAPFDKEFFLEIGVSSGGISDFPDGCRSDPQQTLKPWHNFSPKAEFRFWSDLNTWYPTWSGSQSEMLIDSVKVWSI